MAILVHASLAAVATLFAAVAAAAAPLSDRPIDLVAHSGPSGMEIRIVGHAAAAQTVRYSLEVTDGGGNHSSQSGTARLQPERESVLATVRLGSAGHDGWRATLSVTPEKGEPYVIHYPQ